MMMMVIIIIIIVVIVVVIIIISIIIIIICFPIQKVGIIFFDHFIADNDTFLLPCNVIINHLFRLF